MLDNQLVTNFALAMIDDLIRVDGELTRLVAPLDHDAHQSTALTGPKLVIGPV